MGPYREVRKGEIIVADFLINTIGMSLAFPFSSSLIIKLISSILQSSRKMDFSHVLPKYAWKDGNEDRGISL